MFKSYGYTLIEICIVVCVLAILSGISVVSYRGYTVGMSKKDLKTHAELFAHKIKQCVSVSGGWEIKHPSLKPPNDTLQPCNATPAELKKKLGFTCPAGATCKTLEHPSHDHNHPDGRPKTQYRYFCLSIKKTVSGKKLQVLVRFPWLKPSDSEILCGDDSDVTLSQQNCRGPRGYTHSSMTGLTNPCPWK